VNRRTLTTTALLFSAVAFATTLPQIAFAQSWPFIGTWKLNLAKSTYSPGPPTRSVTTTYQAEGEGVRGTIEVIDAQGNPRNAVFVGFKDGMFHPVAGNPAFDAQADKVVNDTTAWVIRTKAGKVVWTLIGVVSADGKTHTVTETGVNANGQEFYNVGVFDKQ